MGKTHWTKDPPNTATYNKIEKMIRYDVPSTSRTHKKVADWILENWKNVKFP
jgi:hypothetical protein